jgi:hypothetical protein
MKWYGYLPYGPQTPIVAANLPDGGVIKGVTLPGMIVKQ